MFSFLFNCPRYLCLARWMCLYRATIVTARALHVCDVRGFTWSNGTCSALFSRSCLHRMQSQLAICTSLPNNNRAKWNDTAAQFMGAVHSVSGYLLALLFRRGLLHALFAMNCCMVLCYVRICVQIGILLSLNVKCRSTSPRIALSPACSPLLNAPSFSETELFCGHIV